MKNLPLSAAITLPLLLSSFTAKAAYTQNFDNGTTPAGLTTYAISTVNWNALVGNSTTATTTPNTTGPQYRAGWADGTSPSGQNPQLTDYIYVQKGADATTASQTDMDFIIRSNNNTITPFAPSSFSSLTATWTRNGSTVAGHYLMIQRSDAWYVSSTAYTTNGPGQSSTAALNLLTTSWRNLDLTGGFLAIGSTTSTYSELFGLNETITGIGFYVDNLNGIAASATPGTSSFRLDDIVIIPEPSTSLLGVLGFSLIAFRRKK